MSMQRTREYFGQSSRAEERASLFSGELTRCTFVNETDERS